MKRKILMAAIALMAVGCAATGPASYGSSADGKFGYSDSRIESDRYRVTYKGSGGMPPELVEDYALRRAAELTLSSGADWFRVISRNMERDRRGGVSIGAGLGTGSYGRNTSVGVGVGGDLGQVGAQDFFTARFEILTGTGEAPDDGDVYDARNLLDRLGF